MNVSESRVFATAYLKYLRDVLHVNTLRFGAESIDEVEQWFDVADELGMLVFLGRYGYPNCTPMHCASGQTSPPPGSFKFAVENYWSELQSYATHPSLFEYVLSNEISVTEMPDWLPFLKNASTEMRTRSRGSILMLGDAGFGGGMTGDVQDQHLYNGWYGGSRVDLLAALGDPSTNHFSPPKPRTLTETVGTYLSPVAATGPGAGAWSTDGKKLSWALKWGGHQSPAALAVAAERDLATLAGYVTSITRRLRVSNSALAGCMPFTYLFGQYCNVAKFEEMLPGHDALGVVAAAYADVADTVETYDVHVRSGGRVRIAAYRSNDGVTTAPSSKETVLLDCGEGNTAEVQVTFPAVPPSNSTMIQTSLAAPTTQQPTYCNLSIPSSKLSVPVRVGGFPSLQSSPLSRPILLLDSLTNNTSTALEAIGKEVALISVEEAAYFLTHPTSAPSNALLWLGEGSFTASRFPGDTWGECLQAWIASGRNVFVGAQAASDVKATNLLTALPLSVSPSTPSSASPLLPERVDHPIFASVSFRDLLEGSDVANFSVETAFVHPTPNAPSRPDLRWTTSPLRLMWPPGTFNCSNAKDAVDEMVRSISKVEVLATSNMGMEDLALVLSPGILWSGLSLVSRVPHDPVAATLLSNLFSFLSNPLPQPSLPSFQMGDTISLGSDYTTERGALYSPVFGMLEVSCAINSCGMFSRPCGRGPLNYQLSSMGHIEDLCPQNANASGFLPIHLSAPSSLNFTLFNNDQTDHRPMSIFTTSLTSPNSTWQQCITISVHHQEQTSVVCKKLEGDVIVKFWGDKEVMVQQVEVMESKLRL